MSTLIVIPTVPGNENVLVACLECLVRNTPEEYCLYISKNNFDGFAVAVNRGLQAYKQEHIDSVVILNDDAHVKYGWLSKLKAKANESPLTGLVGDKHTIRDCHIAFWIVYIKKEVLESIGLLDERFICGDWEDVDFCIRALDVGWGLTFVPEVLADHVSSHTWRSYPDKMKVEEKKKNKKRFKDKWKGTKWENKW